MRDVKVGIVGCGGIANGKHLPALKESGQCRSQWLSATSVKERAEKTAKEFGDRRRKGVYGLYRNASKKKAQRWKLCMCSRPTRATAP